MNLEIFRSRSPKRHSKGLKKWRERTPNGSIFNTIQHQSKPKQELTASIMASRVKKEVIEQDPYKDEVLGRTVSILFDVDNADGRRGTQSAFFAGTIRQLHMKLENGGRTISIKHFIDFQDEPEDLTFDLREEESMGRLQWLDNAPNAASSAAPSPAKKVKVEKVEEKPAALEMKPAAIKEEEVPVDDEVDEDEDEIVQEEEVDDEVDEDDDEIALPDPLPNSLDGLIRLMDEIEPDEDYFERQADNRGGCSGTRSKLRKFANKNNDHPAVRHWVVTRNWGPPDEETCLAMMDLLKTMIN